MHRFTLPPRADSSLSRTSRLMAVLCVVSLIGCKDRKELPPDSAKAGQGQSAASDTSTQPQDVAVETAPDTSSGLLPGQFAGQLPKKLDEYRTDAPGFYKLIKGAGWKGFRTKRKCTNNPECATQANARLVVMAIRDAHKVDPKIDRQNPGVVVGQVYNDSTFDDATLPLPAGGGTHPDRYFLVIEPNVPAKADTARLRIARVRFRAPDDPEQDLTIMDGYGFWSCGHPKDPTRTRGYAAFSDCTSPPPSPTTGTVGLTGKSTALLSNSLIAGMWMSCADGCCSAGWGDGRGGFVDSARIKKPRGR